MKTRKKIIFLCTSCKCVRPYNHWLIQNDESKEEMKKLEEEGVIEIVKTICEICVDVKLCQGW